MTAALTSVLVGLSLASGGLNVTTELSLALAWATADEVGVEEVEGIDSGVGEGEEVRSAEAFVARLPADRLASVCKQRHVARRIFGVVALISSSSSVLERHGQGRSCEASAYNSSALYSR